MLRRHAAKLETFREQLMQMPRNLLEAGIVACAGQHGEIYASLANGGDRRVALRRAIKEIRTSDDPEQENVLACEYLERLLNADEVAERLLASKPRTIAAATVAPPAPARPADLWQRTTFNGIAYAGGVLNLQQGRTVLDLSTTRIKSNPLPVYQQHSGSRTVGNAQLRIDRTNNVIHLLNGVFLDTPASREILSGFNPETGESHPWQASVGTGQVGRWEQHKGSVRVNDRVFTDVLVARNSVVEECSFVGQGADIFRPNLVIEWKSK